MEIKWPLISKGFHPIINVAQQEANRYFDHFIKRIKFLSDNSIAPGCYGVVQTQYKSRVDNSKDRENFALLWAENLAERLSGLEKEVFVSGAFGLSIASNTYPRAHTNTDLAFMADKNVLKRLVESFKEEGFYLFFRMSGSLNDRKTGKNIKYHLFYPVNNVDEAIKRKYFFSRNLELAKVEEIKDNPHISNKFSPWTHIRLFPHNRKGIYLVCKEDKYKIKYPKDFFRGFLVQLPSTNTINIINQNYWNIRLKAIFKFKESNNPIHIQDLERNEFFLAQQRKQLNEILL